MLLIMDSRLWVYSFQATKVWALIKFGPVIWIRIENVQPCAHCEIIMIVPYFLQILIFH